MFRILSGIYFVLADPCFVRNMGGWLDSANQAIDGLKETFAGGDP